MITLKANNAITMDSGDIIPGDIFKVKPDEAAFLIKKGAAIEVKEKAEKVNPDSPEKMKIKEKAAKARVAAEKVQRRRVKAGVK